MKTHFFVFASLLGSLACAADYPETHRSDFSETLFGHKIDDPYRWLEDANSDETKTWVKEQNAFTRGILDEIPERSAIKTRFTELYNTEKFSPPEKHGNRYFWTYNSGLQNQDVLLWATSPNGKGKLLLDPNKLSSDGTMALNGIGYSHDGKRMAYGLSEGGSDWVTWHVRDVDSGKDLPDVINWSKFSGASWDHEGKGFFYSRYDQPKNKTQLQDANYFQKLYYHKLGTPQSADKLIYKRDDQKEWGFGGDVTEDGKYLVITTWQGTNRENRVTVKDMQHLDKAPVDLINNFSAAYTFLGSEGDELFFQSDKNAPNSQVVAINARKPKQVRTVVKQAKEAIEAVHMSGGQLFVLYMKDAYSKVQVYSPTGKHLRDVKLPGIGAASGFAGEANSKEVFYTYMSFDYPPSTFRYDIKSGKSSLFKQPKVAFKPTDYTTEQVFYKSKDGTKVPMFISYKKGLKRDSTNPTLLYGYGGFNSPMTPFFSPSRLLWMERGGVSAIACIRGGSEYGKAWHDNGRLFKKQNCFDDFIAAAEYLISSKYTQKAKLAIQGGSNGGLLVGACMTQRPELFGACLPEVGVMDMLRFHKFTIGWAWTSDYGSPDKKEDFEYLLKYSPYHNIKKGTSYPPTLIITGDHDDRVVPAHSFKFASAMQWAQEGESPIMIRIETSAGHGAGKPTAKIIDEIADKLAFLTKYLNYPAEEPGVFK